MKQKLLFVISQFYKGGAEVSLLNLLKQIDETKYDIDLMIMNQCPVEDAVSLIPALPKNVNVIDIYQAERSITPMERISRRLLCTQADLQQYPCAALLYIRKRQYDWAFHIGEWWSPAFVACKVFATRKAVWIHTDISSAPSFQSESFFQYDNCIDHYIFVSQRSLGTSVAEFRFLKNKSVCIYNINDADEIRRKSQQIITDYSFKEPVVLTCANIRKEKNHRRQLDAMKLLKERGINFTWINIGSTADVTLTNDLLESAREYGLQDDFLLLGPKENPYPYIARANVVAVLSNYESWSMVITESKILGTPVIATKTSGALEQIEDLKTGVLTEFSVESIAEKLEHFLKSLQLQYTIRKNINNFDNTQQILDSFYTLLRIQTSVIHPSILYVIDDANYGGGAHVATKNQIRSLVEQGKDITIFSSALPSLKTRNEFEGVPFIGWLNCTENQLFERRIWDCLTDCYLSAGDKVYKLRLTYESKVRKNPQVFDAYVKPRLSQLFSQYDIVCVMSEGSTFREEVANSKSKRKVQYIHTDYATWREISDWSRMITANDSKIYERFDKIVLLSEGIKKRFLAIFPELEKKTVVNRNLLPGQEIQKKAIMIKPKGILVRFVTVGRVDYFKGFDRIHRALNKLNAEGYQFQWTIIGDGEDFQKVEAMFRRSEYSESVIMKGDMENPFREIKKADVFALFSRYEGLPNTIYEAMILGIPVIATNVGGISSQVIEGVNGWLIDNDDNAIYEGLKHIFDHPEEVDMYKENLKNYQYDNEGILKKTEQILFH